MKSLSPRRISVGTLIEQRTPCGASCTGFNATRISSTTNSTTPVVSPGRKTGLDLQFDDADAGEIVRHLAHVHLAYGSRRSVSPAPLAGPGSHVIAAPESPVEDGPKPLFPLLRPFGRVRPLLDRPQRLVVTLDDPLHIVGRAGAPLDLQHANARIEKPVQKVDRTEVFGRHDIFVVDDQLLAALAVPDRIGAAAYLATASPVGRMRRLVQAQVALARDGHAERPVREHLDTERLALGPPQIARADAVGNRAHLSEAQLACQHDDIGVLRVKGDGLDIRQIELSGYVHLQPDAAGVENGGLIRRDHGIDPLAPGPVHDPAHLGQILVVEDRIDGQVSLDPVPSGLRDDARQVVERKVERRTRPHVELLDAEIDRIGPGLNGGGQRLVAPHRGHDLHIAPLDSHRRLLSAVQQHVGKLS